MQQKKKKRHFFNLSHLPMDLARIVCSPLLLLFRMKRLTPEGEKYKGRIRGGAILAANHNTFVDPFLLGVTVWYRRLYFLAAEVVMSKKLRSWLLTGVGAIKIDRNIADIEAIRKSVQKLKDGYLLGIFPQGGISEEGEIGAVKSGVVLIALQAGVPIIPMYIVPQKRRLARRVVVIGEPLDPRAYIQKKFPSIADMELVSQKLMEEMNRCAGINKE